MKLRLDALGNLQCFLISILQNQSPLSRCILSEKQCDVHIPKKHDSDFCQFPSNKRNFLDSFCGMMRLQPEQEDKTMEQMDIPWMKRWEEDPDPPDDEFLFRLLELENR